MSDPIKVAILGAGNRGKSAYADRMLNDPDNYKVVAVADVDPEVLAMVAAEHCISPDNCYTSAEELLAAPKLADVAFICTQDSQHYAHAMAAIEKGYDLVLEKPISPSARECKDIAESAEKHGRRVLVCHVLRYTPFFNKVKDIIDSGTIGEIMNVTAEEGVGYWHQAHSFVRGNWRDRNTSSPMILAKCCHDMDILLWLTGKKAKKVSSFGSLNYFKHENAPAGSSERCKDCAPETRKACPYDCYKIYSSSEQGIEHGFTGWPVNVVNVQPTPENIAEALETGPYGRCVFHCDNNVVDSQVVNIVMDDNTTVGFTMTAFSKQIRRKITVRGTKGQIEGDMEGNLITVELFEFGTEKQTYNTNPNPEKNDNSGDHGGGDPGILISAAKLFTTGAADRNTTSIDRSVESHYLALAAEESRVLGGAVLDMDEWVSSI